MKFFIILSTLFLCSTVLASIASADDYSDYNFEKTPFCDAINWRDSRERESYDIMLGKAYKEERFRVFYQNHRGENIADPWYSSEFFSVLFDDNGNVAGYLWEMKNMTLPVIAYQEDRREKEPAMVYARIKSFEVIYEIRNKKRISLMSFSVESIGSLKRRIAPLFGFMAEEYRGIYRGKPQGDYIYAPSLINMVQFLDHHFDRLIRHYRLINRHKIANPAGEIHLELKNRLVLYQTIKKKIKMEVAQYGGKNWENKLKEIQKKWPAMAAYE